MRKLLNNPWFVTALALIALAFVGASLRPKRVVTAPVITEAPAAGASQSVPEEQSSPEKTPSSIDEALKQLALTGASRDPFASRPKVPVATSAADRIAVPDSVDTMRLSAIWTQQGQTYVVINGQIHQPGDQISKIKIESATQEGVWVTHWKGRDFLSLGVDFTLVTPMGAPKLAASL